MKLIERGMRLWAVTTFPCRRWGTRFGGEKLGHMLHDDAGFSDMEIDEVVFSIVVVKKIGPYIRVHATRADGSAGAKVHDMVLDTREVPLYVKEPGVEPG
jgi:hypothetical protein